MFFRRMKIMNKRMLIFAVLLSVSAMPFSVLAVSGACTKKNVFNNNASLRKFCSSYIASLAVGGCIGATTGSIVRYLEKRFDIESSPIALFLILLSWTLESEIRNDIIAGMQKDLDAYKVEYKKGLMFKGAWVASWLAYLQV